MWSVQPGVSNRYLLSHRLRNTSIYEKILRIWYKIVDFFVHYIPDSWQTAIWYPTLGPLYLARRKLIIRQQEESGSKHILEKDKEKGYRMLYFLGTLPEYERKGIGSALLKEGLQEAEEDGVSVYLGATPAGRPLYERNGFRVISLEMKGEQGVCTWEDALMRWESFDNR